MFQINTTDSIDRIWVTKDRKSFLSSEKTNRKFYANALTVGQSIQAISQKSEACIILYKMFVIWDLSLNCPFEVELLCLPGNKMWFQVDEVSLNDSISFLSGGLALETFTYVYRVRLHGHDMAVLTKQCAFRFLAHFSILQLFYLFFKNNLDTILFYTIWSNGTNRIVKK